MIAFLTMGYYLLLNPPHPGADHTRPSSRISFFVVLIVFTLATIVIALSLDN
jgi:hypothetical protein